MPGPIILTNLMNSSTHKKAQCDEQLVCNSVIGKMDKVYLQTSSVIRK